MGVGSALPGMPCVVCMQPRGAACLSSVELRHLRALARSPVHITRESNQLLLARLGVTSSYDYLNKLLQGTIERVDVHTAAWLQAKLTELVVDLTQAR